MTTQTITNPTWAGPSLFVPITLDALLIGTPNRTSTWARVAMDYEQLSGGLNPAPFPFQTAVAPDVGVHLHWTLPAGLRHGRQPAPDVPTIEFPNVPDRWLITRFYHATPGDAPQITAWVLQSDFLGAPDQGTRAYPDPNVPGDLQYLGRYFTLDQWTAQASPATPFLTAPGPGDLSWGAVYDNVRNVFAFYDGLDGAPTGTYSYAVIGWYANPANDPLYGSDGGFTTEEQWQALMAGLQWAVGGPDDTITRIADAVADWQKWLANNPISGGPPLTQAQNTYASQTLCQGLLFDIDWQGPDVAYPLPGALTGPLPTIAIGATAAEAVGIWMGNALQKTDPTVNPDQVEDLLNAFALNRIFDYVSNPTAFAVSEHDARFGSAKSGSVWTVIRPEDVEGEGTGGVQEIPLNAPQTIALTDLNTTQLDIDNMSATLASMRWEIFSAGWKLDNLDPSVPPAVRQQIIDTINALGSAIPQLAAQIEALDAQSQQQQQSLQTLLGDQYVLKISDNPQFEQSADPVVLIAGAATDTKLDQPKHADEVLFTRFTGQTLGGLLVDFTGIASLQPVTLTYDDLLAAVTLPAGTAIPKEAANSWIEALLLDVTSSTWLAKLAFTKGGLTNPTSAQLDALSQRIATQQTLIWNPTAGVPLDQQTIAEASGLQPLYADESVNVPSKISVSPWAPPWTPLYVDWEIEWHPTASDPQEMLTGWQLEELDFNWTGTSIPAGSQTFAVRTLLASDFARGFGESLNDFLITTPKAQSLPVFQLQELQATAAALQTLDILTQSLTGLIQQMIMQQVRVTTPLTNTTAETLSAGVMKWVPTPDIPSYYPIRAGHFQINKLQVVDAYGQILPGARTGATVLPIISQSLRTPGPANQFTVQLAPRVAQPMRLDFRLIDALGGKIRSNSSDATSPICGWLLPNHLDNSLMVFDAAGTSLGELIEIVKDEGTGVRWDAAPGSSAPLGSPPQIDNPHLFQLVNQLLTFGRTDTNALDQLLDLIDVTLWSTDSTGSDVNGNLSVLIGRPIAVVRAAVTMQLDGDPAYDQAFDQTGRKTTDGFPTVPLPLRLGDMALAANGLLGYYEEDDYSTCFAMYGYETSMGVVRHAAFREGPDVRASVMRLLEPSARVAAIAPSADQYVVTDHLAELQPDSTTTLTVTALVDPRGLMPAITGLLPVQLLALPNGPVNAAMAAMVATFRMGPLLLDPVNVRMPLPSDSGGQWSWIERTGVTFWSEQGPLQQSQPEATLPTVVPTLREGWLKLSGAISAGS